MKSESQRSQVDAIYELRDAVEAKVEAEHELEKNASASARDVLLAAQLNVESKTQDAIDLCGECGHGRDDGHTHPPLEQVSGRTNNVVHVNFRPSAEEALAEPLPDRMGAHGAPALHQPDPRPAL